MENSKWDKELDGLWERVSGGPVFPAGNVFSPESAPSVVRESDVETIRFIKHHHREEEIQWRQMLELKERNLGELSARLEETETMLKDLKARYQAEQEKSLQLTLDASVRVEEADLALRRQKESHGREIKLLQELVERARLELKSATVRLDSLRKERDDADAKRREISMESGRLRESKAELENSIAQAREAVEKTLGELLSERKAKADSETEKQKLLVQIRDLESRTVSLQANWEAERKEWRELWDRERSVWETHRQEFAAWEERLRSERQAWHERLKGEEQKEIEYASKLTNVLKESSEWSQRVAQVLKLFAVKGVELPKVFVSEPVAKTVNRAARRAFAVAAAGLMAVTAFAFWARDYRSRVHMKLVSESVLNLPNPTAVVYSQAGLWIADWEKGLALNDANNPSETLRTISTVLKDPFRPGALAADSASLWILDMAQLRIIKQPVEGGAAQSVTTPGPAPAGIAFDGRNLWSFDAATRLLYRFALNPLNGTEANYSLAGVEAPLAMQWVSGSLWILDSKGELRRLVLRDGIFKTLSSQKISASVLSFCVEGGSFWSIERREKGPSVNGFVARRYSLKTY